MENYKLLQVTRATNVHEETPFTLISVELTVEMFAWKWIFEMFYGFRDLQNSENLLIL